MELLPTPREFDCVGLSKIRIDRDLYQAYEQALATLSTAFPITLRIVSEQIASEACSEDVQRQAYRLIIEEGVITITALDQTGLYYGLRTLGQIFSQSGGQSTLPLIHLADWPDLAFRGIQLDIARDMTYRHEHVKDIIRLMGEFKFNNLHLYLEGRFAYPSRPELHQHGLMTPEHARDLCQFAARHKVILIPQVNGLAHMANILDREENRHLRELSDDPNMICPSHPDAVDFVMSMINDLAEAFDTPYIHIGMDEANNLGACPRCRKRLIADGHAGYLLADYINQLAGKIGETGKRPLIWSDMLLDKMRLPGSHAANGGITGWGSRNQTCKALEKLDRQIIICDWQYAYFTPYELSLLREQGFDIMAAVDSDERAPWSPVHGLDTHMQNMFEAAKEKGALGAVICTWSLKMGEVFNNRWVDFAKSAEAMWSDRMWDGDTMTDRISRIMFAVDSPLLRKLDQSIKDNFLSPSLRLVANLMKSDNPWAILEIAEKIKDPAAAPEARIEQHVSFKEQALLVWRKLLRKATRNRALLEAMDLPLRVDLMGIKIFLLRQYLRSIYAYVNENADDRLATEWGREAVLNGLKELRTQVSILHRRLIQVHSLYGNDGHDITKAEMFMKTIDQLICEVERVPGLAKLEDWCPEPLR